MDALTSFDSLELPIPVKKALSVSNISTPTPIQAEAIPRALAGSDVIGLAQTGTGKTLSFCLPIVTLMDKNGDNDEAALILAPTREIAIQVTEVLKHLTAKMTGRWHPVLVIGGVGMQPQIDGLRKKPRFIVATPGRLVDHMREGHAKLSNVKFLVLDEADRMLDMGFAPQLNEVLRGLPRERQTLLFSATFPKEIEEISKKYLNSPVRVEVGPGHSVPIESIAQETREMTEDQKFDQLLDIIGKETGNLIVFMRTKYRTEKLARNLEKLNISAGRIHGDRSQSQRQTTLKAFKDGDIRVLVATDIAARGIDVPDVGLVINYDLPNVPEEYIHRIGRTGRAGASGKAIAFITDECREEWRDILKLINPELYAKTPRVANTPKPEKPQQNRGPRQHGQHGQRGGHQGARHEQRHEQRAARPQRHERQERQARHADESHAGAQPSLEEQLSRIDRAQPRQRRPQHNGAGQRFSGGRSPHGGAGKGQQRRYNKDRPNENRGTPNNNMNTRPSPTNSYVEQDDSIGNRAAGTSEDKKKGWDFMGWFRS